MPLYKYTTEWGIVQVKKFFSLGGKIRVEVIVPAASLFGNPKAFKQ